MLLSVRFIRSGKVGAGGDRILQVTRISPSTLGPSGGTLSWQLAPPAGDIVYTWWNLVWQFPFFFFNPPFISAADPAGAILTRVICAHQIVNILNLQLIVLLKGLGK